MDQEIVIPHVIHHILQNGYAILIIFHMTAINFAGLVLEDYVWNICEVEK